MAKKMSSLDAALEASRKVRVPKKPVKTKGKKTVATKLDWGPGIPDDKLAYLNDDEMALVQANRMFKGERNVNGVPAFPDPGDTAAGGNSRLPDSGGGPGTRGSIGGGNKTSGAGGSSPSASSAPSSGAGGQSASSGSKTSSPTAAPSGGPTGGSLSAPARTEPSRSVAPTRSLGSNVSNMPGTPVSVAPSQMAYEGALNRIAQGSSIVGTPSSQKMYTDRVPGSVAGMPAYTPAAQPVQPVQPMQKMQDRLEFQTPYGLARPEAISQMSPEDQAVLSAFAQTPTYTPPTFARPVNYGFVGPLPSGASPSGNTRGIGKLGANAGEPSYTQTEIDIPGYPGPRADVSPSQGDYSPSQAPAYDLSPSQQSGWTSAQRDAYLGGLGGSRAGVMPLPVSQTSGSFQGFSPPPAAPLTTLTPMPNWVDYSYLQNNYPQLPLGVTPDVGNFNQYNTSFRRGGRIGDSIEAALRLAGQNVVRREKTS